MPTASVSRAKTATAKPSAFTWGDVDGVPAVWPARRLPGPIQASLLFGVGKSNETFGTSGITHLVEHLALEPLGQQPYMYNGMVGPVVTKFVTMGAADQVAGFYRTLTETLRNLSADRFAKEIKVLRVEGQRAAAGQLGFDLSLRFGAVGPGLVGWAEHGLNRLSFEDAAAWAERWFVRSNAVLWLSAPPPRKLTLAALEATGPKAKRVPARVLTDAPTWVPVNTAKVSVSFLAKQQWGLAAMHMFAEGRCVERLRREEALTYSVGSHHVRLPNARSLEYFEADAAAGEHKAVIAGMREVFDELATAGPTKAELELWRATLEHLRDAPQAIVARLDNAAERHVLGLATPTPEETDARIERCTPKEVRNDLAAVIDTMVVVGPNDVGATVDGLSPLADWSEGQPLGDEYRPIDGREKGLLVVGDDAISWSLDDAHSRIVGWKDAVGVLAWDSGVRTVVGPTGTSVVVTPWNWQAGDDIAAIVDERVGHDRWIRVGAGTTEYRRDTSKPESVAQVRWIASLVGAMQGKARVDIGLMSDGLLVVRGRGKVKLEERLTDMRSRPREELLEAHPGSDWWPLATIRSAKYRRAGGLRFSKATIVGSLIVEVDDTPPMKFDLTTAAQVSNVLTEFPKVLGARFSRGR